MVDKAPREWAGGNSYFTAGAFRTTFAGLDDLRPLLTGLSEDTATLVDLPPYTETDFLGDLNRVTHGRSDPQWARLLAATAARALVLDQGGAVTGVDVVTPAGPRRLRERAVVLSAGGFEANPRLRAAYLGPGWDLALVRGTPYNAGEVIGMAIESGAQVCGHWSGCHAVAWDAGAAATGDRRLTKQLTRGGYPYGIVVNRNGQRRQGREAHGRHHARQVQLGADHRLATVPRLRRHLWGDVHLRRSQDRHRCPGARRHRRPHPGPVRGRRTRSAASSTTTTPAAAASPSAPCPDAAPASAPPAPRCVTTEHHVPGRRGTNQPRQARGGMLVPGAAAQGMSVSEETPVVLRPVAEVPEDWGTNC